MKKWIVNLEKCIAVNGVKLKIIRMLKKINFYFDNSFFVGKLISYEWRPYVYQSNPVVSIFRHNTHSCHELENFLITTSLECWW